MSRVHREILHLARLLGRIATDLTPADADRYLIRDAQRVIEAIESLVRMHNAQDEDRNLDRAVMSSLDAVERRAGKQSHIRNFIEEF